MRTLSTWHREWAWTNGLESDSPARGIGYGGSCFPKELQRSLRCSAVGVDFGLLEEVEKINELQKERFFQKIRPHSGHSAKAFGVSVLRLGRYGRYSRSRRRWKLSAATRCRGLNHCHDLRPLSVRKWRCLRMRTSIHRRSYAAGQADALLILTDWRVWPARSKKLRYNPSLPDRIDGRNLFDPGSCRILAYLSECRPAIASHSVESAATKRWP